MIADELASCDALFTPDGLALIREILGWIRILAPALVVLFVAVDFSSAVMSHDNDALSKATKKVVPRLIGVALLFFVPTIVKASLDITGIKSSLSDDPLCSKATGTEAKGLLFFSDSYSIDSNYKSINTNTNQKSEETQQTKVSLYGPGDNNKRSYRTVNINGRTYDEYVQKYLRDIPFQGCNLADCGCSAMAFASAASGFDRSITAYEAANLVKSKSFDGIKLALTKKGIGYSGPYYYNSNDNNEARVQQLSQQIREHLAQGKPAIALVAGGSYANQNHFITLFGEDENGNLILGNCRRETGTIETLVRESMCGGRKGVLLVG